MNRLNKTKIERVVDHEQERIERLKKENAEKRAAAAAKVSAPPACLLCQAKAEGMLWDTEESGRGAREGAGGGEGSAVVRHAVRGRRGGGGRGGGVQQTEKVGPRAGGGLHVIISLILGSILVFAVLRFAESDFRLHATQKTRQCINTGPQYKSLV